MKEVGELLVKDILRRKFPKLKTNDTIYKIIDSFENSDLRALPVFEDGKFKGEIHEIDLLKLAVNAKKIPEEEIIKFGFNVDFGYFAKKAKDILNKHEISVSLSDKVSDVAWEMLKNRISVVPVFDKKEFKGIVCEEHIIDKIKQKVKR